MHGMRNASRWFLPMALVWSLAAGLTVLVQHEVLRLQADDPQLAMAGDAARRLEGGADPQSVLPATAVDLARDQSPFVAVYDASGAALASSATLRGQPPSLPAGVLQFAQRNGGHRLSWQPQPGLRQALVIVPVHGRGAGFVVAGRSLRETERRKLQVLHLGLIAWVAGLLACALLARALPRRAS